jgi:hypothetical protein
MASILSRRFRLPGLMRDLDNTPLGVQHPHDEVAVCPRAVDEAGHVAGNAGVGEAVGDPLSDAGKPLGLSRLASAQG